MSSSSKYTLISSRRAETLRNFFISIPIKKKYIQPESALSGENEKSSIASHHHVRLMETSRNTVEWAKSRYGRKRWKTFDKHEGTLLVFHGALAAKRARRNFSHSKSNRHFLAKDLELSSSLHQQHSIRNALCARERWCWIFYRRKLSSRWEREKRNFDGKKKTKP